MTDPERAKQVVVGAFDRGAETYEQVGVEFFGPPGRDLVARSRLAAGERVLDLGTGRGAVLFPAAEAVGPHGRVVGLDLAPRMVELTAAEAKARGLQQVSTVVGDAEHPDFAAGSFDAVLAALVLFFLVDPGAALRRYADLIAPGGRLAFTTFAAMDPVHDAGMRAIAQFATGSSVDRSARQGPFSTPDSISALLTENGYATPEIDEQAYESRFDDPDHWIAWISSHGGRLALERVPPEHLDEALAAGRAAFEAARTDRGDYAIRTTFRFTVAQPR
jgi:ubiquinone/menaquinone biosynthesis C-methylase UbiE